MGQPLLEGETWNRADPAQHDDGREARAEIARLLQVNKQLDEALRLERIRTQTIEAGVKDLRNILHPLYKALRLVFGEIDQMDLGETPGAVAAPQFDPKWEAWMKKFSGTAPERVIRAILDHGPLNRSQLRQATKMGWSTLDTATTRLKNLDLIEKSNDRWNLK